MQMWSMGHQGRGCIIKVGGGSLKKGWSIKIGGGTSRNEVGCQGIGGGSSGCLRNRMSLLEGLTEGVGHHEE